MKIKTERNNNLIRKISNNSDNGLSIYNNIENKKSFNNNNNYNNNNNNSILNRQIQISSHLSDMENKKLSISNITIRNII